MHMPNGLARLRTAVHDEPVPLVEPQLCGESVRHQGGLPKEFGGVDGEVGHFRNMELRNHQEVSWGLRVDIAKCEALVVLSHDLCRHLALDDATEQALAHKEERCSSAGWLFACGWMGTAGLRRGRRGFRRFLSGVLPTALGAEMLAVPVIPLLLAEPFIATCAGCRSIRHALSSSVAA